MVGANLTDEPIRLDSLVGESSIARMRNLFDSLDKPQRETFLETLVTEFNGFFDTELQWENYASGDYQVFLHRFEQEVVATIQSPDYKFDSGATMAIMMMLSENPEKAIQSFASDLAEVLFLDNYGAMGSLSADPAKYTPFIQRLFLGYAVRVRELSRIFDELTKPYCGDQCPSKPVGCCDSEVSTSPIMHELRDFESKRKGRLDTNSYACIHHDLSIGCSLKLFRPPLCIGHICENLKESLERKYDNHVVSEFLTNLDLVAQEIFSSYRLLEYMDNAIQAGRQLIQD